MLVFSIIDLNKNNTYALDEGRKVSHNNFSSEPPRPSIIMCFKNLILKGTVHLFGYFEGKLNSLFAVDWY